MQNRTNTPTHTHCLSSSWDDKSRGTHLTSNAFDTKLLYQKDLEKLHTVVVRPIKTITGRDSAGEEIKKYIVYAAVVVDDENYKRLEQNGLVTAKSEFMNQATKKAEALNNDVSRAYNEDRLAGKLCLVHSWEETGIDRMPVIRIEPAANTRFSNAHSGAGFSN